jgi:soluble cytochrome b562
MVYGGRLAEYYDDLHFPLLHTFSQRLELEETKLDRIIVILTDQEAAFPPVEKRLKRCPYWQDTCSLKPILEKYFQEKFPSTRRDYLYLKPQSTTRGLDNWDQAMILVQQALSSIEFDEMATIYVSHQAGTPAVSSAVQFVSLDRFGKQVKFLVSNGYDQKSADLILVSNEYGQKPESFTMDWLVIWGVTQAVGFAFKKVFERLVSAALEDYVKYFFKGSIKDLIDLAKEKPLKVAFGQVLKEFLNLVQQELEDADVDDSELKEYTDSLDEFIRDQAVLENLGKPFQEVLGDTSQAHSQSLNTVILVQTWNNLNLKALPNDFDWERVAKRYRKKVGAIVRNSDNLRQLLDSGNLAKIRQSLDSDNATIAENNGLPRARSLFELLQQCTVMVSSSGQGTGFFVAPGLILTFASIVGGQNTKSVINVFWQNQDYTAELDILLEEPQNINLALIRLSNPVPNHPCVYLDESVEAGDRLYTYCYTGGNRNGESATFECGGVTDDNPPLLIYRADRKRPGSAGAPLLNLRTGKVCGVVESFHPQNTDFRGEGISTTVILSQLRELAEQQREFHQRDKLWTKLLSRFKQKSATTLSERMSERVVAYDVLLSVSPESVPVGGELEATIYLNPAGTIDSNTYLLEVQPDEAVGGELNIFLTAPGFQFNGDNTTSLPLAPDSSGEVFPPQPTQTAHFSLTALRAGSTTIKAELYCGETFKKNLETEVQVAGFDEAELRPLIAARSRPVPQPDLILQVRSAWNEDISACTFRYHIDTFQQRLLFADDSDYCSESLPAGWVERSHLLLKTTLEDAASSLSEDFSSRLASLGQYLFQSLLPAELQSIFRSIAGFNRPFTWLILADQDAWFPWELLHDGQTFLGDRFIIGRWLWELDKARPYEFPVGAVNVAHYASVEQPEVWTALLEPPGAPPPIPLPGGLLADLSSTESMRGLHLVRSGQSSDAANRRDAPVLVNGSSGNLNIEREVQPAKLSLRRNRPLVTLGYVSAGQPELTALEHTWASTFVRAGCSAFVGSLWAVQPDVEAAFVSGFYHNLWAGQSLGMAFQAARRLARAVAPDSLDWLAYVLFGDPMARPYRPVEGQGYAVVEPIGQEIDDPVPPGATVRFRVSLRRTPPVWYENRLMEVAEDLAFEDLQVFIVTSGLQVTPADSVEMRPTPTGDYLGWFSLSVPQQMESQSVLVQVFFEDGMEPVHNLRFQVLIGNRDGEGR